MFKKISFVCNVYAMLFIGMQVGSANAALVTNGGFEGIDGFGGMDFDRRHGR